VTRRAAQALRPELQPTKVFDNPPRNAARYELRAMVCYYGSHYAAYARTDDPDVTDSRCARRRACARLRVF
jgi:hypothetical protein